VEGGLSRVSSRWVSSLSSPSRVLECSADHAAYPRYPARRVVSALANGCRGIFSSALLSRSPIRYVLFVQPAAQGTVWARPRPGVGEVQEMGVGSFGRIYLGTDLLSGAEVCSPDAM